MDAVQTAPEGIESINAAIEHAADIKSLEASLDANIGRASLADISSADASIRAADTLVPKSAVEIADLTTYATHRAQQVPSHCTSSKPTTDRILCLLLSASATTRP